MLRTRSTIAIALGAATAVGMIAPDAHADTIEAKFNNVNPKKTVRYTADGGLNYAETHAGLFNWTRTGGTYAGDGAQGDYLTFCIELTEHISGGSTYTYDVVAPEDAPNALGGMGIADADRLARLWGTHFDAGFTSSEAAAFQLAVWNIVHDDDLDVTSGMFSVSNTDSYVSLANSFLADAENGGPREALLAKTADGAQDHLFAVPAPGSIALAGVAGLFAAGGRRRRHAEI